MPSFLRSGYFALNYKDVLPQGFIDQYVTKTFQDEALRPQGSFLVNLFDGAVPAVGYSGKVYGKPMPWFRLIYTSSTEDIGPSDSNIDDPADPYPYKQYFIFVDYEYFNSQGVALGKKVTTKFTVNIVRDEERLQPNTSTVKWMLDDEDEVYFDIYPAPNSSISVENQSKVIGIEYFDPYFTSKIVRLLPASSMGVIVDYFYNLTVPIVPQNNFSSFAGFDLFGLASNQAAFDSLMGAKISKPVDYKWGLQLVNAKTVVNKEITITPQVFSTRGSLAADGVEIFYIPILSSDKGITKILCASKDMVDFNQSDLKVLGKGFVEVGMGDGGNSSEGIDEQKLKDAKPLGFAIVQNRELKKKYKSGSSIENFPQIGNNTQYMINSPLFVFNEDSVANGIYIFAPKNFLRSGDTIFVTYGQVDKHELRHVGQKRHIYFQQSGLGEFQVISSHGGQYEFKKFSFDVLSSHLENNIFIRNISGRNVDLANSSSSSGSSYDSNFNYKGYDSSDFSRAADFSVATHLDWLSDNPENPISSSSSSSKNLEKFNCYRLTKVKLSPALYPSGLPANGYFVARSIGVSVQGVDYGPGIYHIDSFGNAKLLLSGSGVRDQEWWRSSFDSLGVYDVSLESERGQLEFVYDVSQLTNSYIVDDRKIPYEINFAKALSSVSKFSANCGENQGVSYPWISRNLSNIESSNTGVGICILDFININSLRTKIAGTDVFFSSNCRKYIDASNSVFDFSRSTNQVWGFELKQGLSGGSSGASIFSSVLYYFYYSPIEFNKNGRIIWEGIGPGAVQSTTIKVTTREASPPSIGGHFETSNLINGAVVVPSESDSSIRLFKCKSMVASDPKGDTKNARLSFPDSSYMESDFLNSFSDPRPSIYKWMPIDDAPFYSKGRRIMPKYYEYPNLNHSNYISKKIYGDLREFSSLKLKAQKYRYGFLGGSDQAGWSSKEPVIQTKNHLEILVEFDSRIEHMEITLKFSKSDLNINIGYVHIYFDDDDDKSNALFVPCKSLNSIGEYSIRFDFFANYNKRIKIIVPEKDLYPSSMLHVTSLIDESDYVEYRSTFLTSENFDISFSKTGFSIMFFTDTNEATLDACLFNNHDEMPRIIRSVFQSFGDEKVSFICCRNPPRQNNIFVMFQLDDTILLKTFDPNSLLYSEFDLMPVVNYNAFAYADILISANSEKRIVSLNPENYSKFQDNFAGITIKNKNYCNNFRISPAQFVHGNCKTELSSFIYAEANGEYAFSQLANQYSVQSGLNQASANYSQLSSVNVIRYLSNNDTFYPRFFDSASNIKFNRMLNSQRFSFEILNDGSIVLFMCNSGSLFIKIGSQGGAFRDITSDIYKFPDLVFDEFGLIPFRPVKFKKSEKGSKYTIENNSQNEIKSYLLQSAPEIEFVSSVYDDYSNTLYLFYIIENKLFYQYFNGYFLLNKNFINSMTTDTDFNEKSLPVYVCGSLGDLQDVIYTEECYFINPYIDYKDSIINFPISNVPPVGIVMPNGWIRVYVKDENDYLRSFSINGSRVIPDTFFSTSSAL